MNRSELTNVRRRQIRSNLWIAALVVAAAVIGSLWLVFQNRAQETNIAGVVISQPALPDGGTDVTLQLAAQPRAADLFSAELDRLRSHAFTVANREQVVAHTLSLEALAQAGREAFVSSRLPTTANGHAVYLEALRRQGQAANSEADFPATANEFSEWLDRLRRTSN